MVTTTERPVSCIVTRTRVPSGSESCAAVIAFWSNRSPMLVRFPLNPGPYHDA